MKDGTAFALRDICPHRGVPLSAGKVMPEGAVECPYHGWRFRADGQCSLIPSLVGGEAIKAESIRVRSYPVREQDGLLWVYMARKATKPPRPAESRRRLAVPNAIPRWSISQTFRCAIDPRGHRPDGSRARAVMFTGAWVVGA